MGVYMLQSCLSLCNLWAVARQVPLSMGLSRQEYWNGLPCPPPGDLPDPGIEPMSLVSLALAGRLFITSATWEAPGGKKKKTPKPQQVSMSQRLMMAVKEHMLRMRGGQK